MFKVRSLVTEHFFENLVRSLASLHFFENLGLKIQKTVHQVLLVVRSLTLLFHFAVFIVKFGIVMLKVRFRASQIS